MVEKLHKTLFESLFPSFILLFIFWIVFFLVFDISWSKLIIAIVLYTILIPFLIYISFKILEKVQKKYPEKQFSKTEISKIIKEAFPRIFKVYYTVLLLFSMVIGGALILLGILIVQNIAERSIPVWIGLLVALFSFMIGFVSIYILYFLFLNLSSERFKRFTIKEGGESQINQFGKIMYLPKLSYINEVITGLKALFVLILVYIIFLLIIFL